MQRTLGVMLSLGLFFACGGQTLTSDDCNLSQICPTDTPAPPAAPSAKPAPVKPTPTLGQCKIDQDCPKGQSCFGSECLTIGEIMPFPDSAALEPSSAPAPKQH